MTDPSAGRGVFKIPHDLVNEQILLTSAILDKAARELLISRVRSDMFVDDSHSRIWNAVQECDRKNISLDLSSLAQISRVDKSYLDELVQSHPTSPANVRHHLEALLWDSTRAKSVSGPLSELVKALKDPSTPPERVRALAAQLPISLQGSGSRKFLRDSDKLATEHGEVIADRRKGIAVYPFGIPALDCYGAGDIDEKGNSLDGQPLLLPGAAPGKITVVTAISGGGKSTLTALMALNLARQGRKILYGAWEMGAGETLELLACISCQISRSRVRTGNITDIELKLLQSTMHNIGKFVKFVEMPFHKQLGVRKTHDEVLDELHSYIADAGCDVAIFDLWRRAFRQLKGEAEEAEALYRMQAIAEETQVHTILVQQQRLKEVEKRINTRPTREGIKGSSAWVDVADLILGVYIPSLVSGTACNTIETLVLKQRFGKWPIAVEHAWDGDIVALSNGRVVAYEPGSEDDLGSKDGATNWLKGRKS